MLTRFIYPFSLREKITWRIKKYFPNIKDKNVSLTFDKKLKLDLSKNDVGHQSIIFNGYYELNLTQSIISLGKKGGLLMDIGANYGYFSCLWVQQNPMNRSIAFEASPANILPLQNNVEKNRLTEKITIVPIAAGKEQGHLKFDLGNESQQTGWGGLTINDHNNAIEVEVDTLDNYADRNQISKIDVLKIDTEGADTWVLYGAENLLRERKIKHIFFEHNKERMKELNIGENNAKIFLEKMGYSVKKISETDLYATPMKILH